MRRDKRSLGLLGRVMRPYNYRPSCLIVHAEVGRYAQVVGLAHVRGAIYVPPRISFNQRPAETTIPPFYEDTELGDHS